MSSNYLARDCEDGDGEDDGDDLVPGWNDGGGEPTWGEQLTMEQKEELSALLSEFDKVLQATPGCTSVAEHEIETGDAPPVSIDCHTHTGRQ